MNDDYKEARIFFHLVVVADADVDVDVDVDVGDVTNFPVKKKVIHFCKRKEKLLKQKLKEKN